MAKYCPILDKTVLYVDCLDCEEKHKCRNFNASNNNEENNENPQS